MTAYTSVINSRATTAYLVNAVHNDVILWDVAANAQEEEENLPATWSPKKSETMVADKFLSETWSETWSPTSSI